MTPTPGSIPDLIGLLSRYEAMTALLIDHVEHLLAERDQLIDLAAECRIQCPLLSSWRT